MTPAKPRPSCAGTDPHALSLGLDHPVHWAVHNVIQRDGVWAGPAVRRGAWGWVTGPGVVGSSPRVAEGSGWREALG